MTGNKTSAQPVSTKVKVVVIKALQKRNWLWNTNQIAYFVLLIKDYGIMKVWLLYVI